MATTFHNATRIESGTAHRVLSDDTLILGPAALAVSTGADADAVTLAGGNTLRVMGAVVAADGRGVVGAVGGSTVGVAAGGSVFGASRGIHVLGEFNAIDVAGEVTGGEYGVVAAVLGTDAIARNAVSVAQGGRIHAGGVTEAGVASTGVAVWMTGQGSRLLNAGDVTARGTAVLLGNPSLLDFGGGLSLTNSGHVASVEATGAELTGAGRASVTNSGTIEGVRAVSLRADTVDVRNDGMLRGADGVALAVSGFLNGYSATVVNAGSIVGGGGIVVRFAVEFGSNAGTATLVNSGEIQGGVRFRSGDALYDGSAGVLTLGVVQGGLGRDTLLGGTGAESLFGGDGSDTLRGGAGDDVLRGGRGADLLDGGAGLDEVDYSLSPTGVRIDLNRGLAIGAATDIFGFAGDDQASGDTLVSIERLRGSAYNDTLGGGGLDDTLRGGEGDDLLLGRGGADLIEGGAGTDTLSGMGGADVLDGGDGSDLLEGGGRSDTLIGGRGNDTLVGGTAPDVFRYLEAEGTEDTILDFTRAGFFDADLIDLSAFAASGAGLSFIGGSGFGGLGNELRVVALADRSIVELDVDGGGSAELVFTVMGSVALTAADFLL